MFNNIKQRPLRLFAVTITVIVSYIALYLLSSYVVRKLSINYMTSVMWVYMICIQYLCVTHLKYCKFKKVTYSVDDDSKIVAKCISVIVFIKLLHLSSTAVLHLLPTELLTDMAERSVNIDEINIMWWLVTALVIAPICEEYTYRYYLPGILLENGFKSTLGVSVITSLLFGFMHGTFFHIITGFMLGLFLSALRYITNNIWVCIFAHMTYNVLCSFSMFENNNYVLCMFSLCITLFLLYMLWISISRKLKIVI